MKFFIVFIAALWLSAAPATTHAQARKTTNKKNTQITCAVNTYNADGTDFKNLVASVFTIRKGIKNEIYRSAAATYYAYASSEDKDGSNFSSLMVEITNADGSAFIASANSKWTTGTPGVHGVSVSSADAEPNVKTMFFCE